MFLTIENKFNKSIKAGKVAKMTRRGRIVDKSKDSNDGKTTTGHASW